MNETVTKLNVKSLVQKVLGGIEREREREILSRRFGLFERKETLEQIGEFLGITRERVRQLEKSILARLKAQADEGELTAIQEAEKYLILHLSDHGRVATVRNLALNAAGSEDDRTQAHIALLATIAPGLEVIDENDFFHHSIAIKQYHDEKKVKQLIKTIVDDIKANNVPVSLEELHARLRFEHPKHIEALALSSKELATLGGVWGYIKWPLVNPKNIRDKIYVILKDQNKPMHFSEIAKRIRESTFRRKDVTTQAIHNELIKDNRFVLIGRGIYALKEWGYKKGTVADVITDVLKKAGKPLHRDEIVRRVLKSRKVKETTILLNLQGKSQFKRVAKATYDIVESQ